MRKTAITLCLALCAALPALATDNPAAGAPDDLDALTLADKAPAEQAEPKQPWRLFIEGAGGQGELREDGSHFGIARGSLDVRVDASLTKGLRAVFSDRLDLVHSDGQPPGENVNTLREAYLSWARTDDQNFDLGRVNVRNGAAMGFNPTDWFKANALRSITSPDPAVLRENRQGTVVLQAQQLWSEGALTATFSPRLARSENSATFALDAGATNPNNRWLLAGSVKVSDKFSPQLLVYGGEDTPAQVGLNLSGLIGDSAVVYGEFSAGQGVSLISQALGLPEDESTQKRAALGLTYTTPFNLSLTAEADYSSAGASAEQWNALPVAARQQVLATSQKLQDLPTRREWFVYASWKDMLVRRFDMSGFVRRDSETGSSMWWLEGRYHWERAELALQWQINAGNAGSVYYTVPQQQTLQLVLRVYL